jgi:hypothetical protein
MSTITVTNIKATGETASRSVSGVAAAWCHWDNNGGNDTKDSLNVSSRGDLGTGYSSVNFTNSFKDSLSKSVTTGANDVDAGSSFYDLSPHTYTASQVQFDGWKQTDDTTTQVDLNRNMTTIHGDLA